MKEVDFLFLIEHEDREGETINTLAECLHSQGVSCVVLSIEFHSYLLPFYQPKCVVFPYSISSKRWPISYFNRSQFADVKLVSMNWEQLLSTANKDFKKPKGKLIKEQFKHLCWSDDFKSFLIGAGIKAENTAVLGNPAHEILFRVIKNSSNWDKRLRNEFSITPNSEIIFLPMNYGWAFASDRIIKSKINMGYASNVAWEYREYSKRCLCKFVDFAIDLAYQKKDSFLVIRPHPSISIEQYLEVFSLSGKSLPNNIIFSKKYTIREWISIADIIGSSWSTTVWDAVCIGKKGFLYTPEPRPFWLNTYWNDKVLNVANVSELMNANNLYMDVRGQPDEIINSICQWLLKWDVGTLKAKREIEILPLKALIYMVRTFIRTIAVKYFRGIGVSKGLQRDFFQPIKFSSKE